MHMDSDDPTLEALLNMNGDPNVPVVGQIQMAPPIVLQGPDGRRYALPQVFVAVLNEDAVNQIAARAAAITVHEVLSEMEKRGIISAQLAAEEEPNKSDPTLEQPSGDNQRTD